MSNLEIETDLWSKNIINICGIDEVGRGCLAGPVYSAAVVLDQKTNFGSKDFNQINDSKKLSEKKREKLFDYIIDISKFGIGICTVEEIDHLGIQQAVKVSMIRAVESLEIQPDHLLIDNMKLDLDIPQTSIIKGDQISKSISSASIIAKVSRDNLMKNQISNNYPMYKFEKNKGYGTKEHMDAIKTFGITKQHRKSFEPIKSMIENNHEAN
ncbi:MAG: ribonuclease HII [Chloroflexi bacterium]|jgi:ribonuclease HII|nr:ribonuclease HII [Chloroflexota bacterium]MQG43830.1 ribonuclease HII [SAR202 cluster bacterium]|tara:strand:- start:2799 stop:3434 length:636 start_codon:yes stop_codon:yes gene_type:complete